ncbi:MAG: YrhB domain-containing protein [Candidatus Thiodiazotropha sp.]
MNLDDARNRVEKEVLSSKPDCALVEGNTREYPHCFAFFYQSKKYIETGDFRYMLVGHGSVLVARDNGRVFETGSAFPLDHYIEALEVCGDPYGEPTIKVKVTGWHEGANKVEATKLIKRKAGIGLAQAKKVIDKALKNEESIISFKTAEEAEEVVMSLDNLGFHSTQLWSNQC